MFIVTVAPAIQQLYDSGEQNLELLNRSGSNVFELLQILIVKDAMLCLCRLTDPEGLPGRENASIRSYLKTVTLKDEENTKVKGLLAELKLPMKNIRISV